MARLSIPRFYGLDLKNNIIDVKDGQSLDSLNVFQSNIGVVSKRPGQSVIFASDEAALTKIQEIGAATLSGVKYYFKFVGGEFKYSTSISGATTTISPSPAIHATNDIYWAVIDSKLYFVDGSNVLRYFNGSAIKTSLIYLRPTVAATSASGGSGFVYTYTVDNGLGESPSCSTVVDKVSAATIDIAGNTGPQTLAIGDKIRIYSKVNTLVAQYRNVTPLSGAHANGTYGSDDQGGYLLLSSTAASYAIVTVALNIDQAILYTDLGVAPNAPAVSGLTGITIHYGRLVAWKGSNVYLSKVSNPDSWPSDTAVKEAWSYGFYQNDGEDLTVCFSFQESLYVFKDTKIAAFGGIGPDDTGNNAFTFRRLETNGIGCVGGKSVQAIGDQDGKANYMIWLSAQGFYASTGDKPIRVGEKIETQVFDESIASKRKTVSLFHKRSGHYYAFIGSDSEKTGWVFDVQKDDGELVGWSRFADLNPTCIYWDVDKFIFGTNGGFCAQENIAGTSDDFSDINPELVAAASITTATDIITVANSYQTGDPVIFRTSGTIPAGLVNNTRYFAIRVSATQIKLATTEDNATAGTAINITSQGVGVHSLVGAKAISAYYTTNWIKFGSGAHVKKLMKPMIYLNAAASDVNLTMKIAVDWFDSFFDSHTIAFTSTDLWGTLAWGSFIWGAGSQAVPKNVAISRRKVRAIRYKFENNTINQDFNLKGLEQEFTLIRNRGELID